MKNESLAESDSQGTQTINNSLDIVDINNEKQLDPDNKNFKGRPLGGIPFINKQSKDQKEDIDCNVINNNKKFHFMKTTIEYLRLILLNFNKLSRRDIFTVINPILTKSELEICDCSVHLVLLHQSIKFIISHIINDINKQIESELN